MNGEFIQLSEAKIPTLEWGFLRSDATYGFEDYSSAFFNDLNASRAFCRDSFRSITGFG